MNNIDYPQLLDNLKNMINLLEYDSMRSPGKAKMNCENLLAMHTLKDIYIAQIETSKPTVVKPAAKKEG
jgi:hypothetical protein|tara:strand:- start:37 stop:243 length:207 start_codon:yes stop_codon:yes gene_type:complete